jgi:S1-C subfamily serine protease
LQTDVASGSAGAFGVQQLRPSNSVGSGAAMSPTNGNGGMASVAGFVGQRGVLGLEVKDDVAGGDVCLRVASVVPGGRADMAGVRMGDQIVRWNSTRVSSKAGFKAALQESSHVGVRLLSLMCVCVSFSLLFLEQVLVESAN